MNTINHHIKKPLIKRAGLASALVNFFIVFLNGQSYTQFYDYKWQPSDAKDARFYSKVSYTDSGWLKNDYFLATRKLQMTALFSDSACSSRNGYAKNYHANGRIESFGRFINGKAQGLHIKWHYNRQMADSAFFVNGHQSGTRLKWHHNGNLSDSIAAVNDSTFSVVSWFDNGQLSSTEQYINRKKEGVFTYFHKNGQKAAIIKYSENMPAGFEYFNEDGSTTLDTSATNRKALFNGGEKAWKRFLKNNLFWNIPENYSIKNGNSATAVFSILINEDGKVEDAIVLVPFHDKLDQIALDVLKKSSGWLPSKRQNRILKQWVNQSITFVKEDY
jgi:antitoxin component YwqK of YwqJK toxin-antitoxin module